MLLQMLEVWKCNYNPQLVDVITSILGWELIDTEAPVWNSHKILPSEHDYPNWNDLIKYIHQLPR